MKRLIWGRILVAVAVLMLLGSANRPAFHSAAYAHGSAAWWGQIAGMLFNLCLPVALLAIGIRLWMRGRKETHHHNWERRIDRLDKPDGGVTLADWPSLVANRGTLTWFTPSGRRRPAHSRQRPAQLTHREDGRMKIRDSVTTVDEVMQVTREF